MGDPVRLDWSGQALRPGHDRRADRRLADRSLRGPARDRRRARRLRAVRAPALAEPGHARQLVVLPTNTWQAYNFYDRDGDGWGDTWYAGGSRPVELDRPYRDRGVPPRFRRYDLPFLHWLAVDRQDAGHRRRRRPRGLRHGRRAARALRPRRLPGPQRVHDRARLRRRRALSRPRRTAHLPLGEQLLLARREGGLHDPPRPAVAERGPSRGALLGVQYRANDDGRARARSTSIAAEAAPWLFEGTGLAQRSTLGRDRRRVRDRDRLDDAGLPARDDACSRGSRASTGLGCNARDEPTTRRQPGRASSRPARSTSAAPSTLLADQPHAGEPLAPHARGRRSASVSDPADAHHVARGGLAAGSPEGEHRERDHREQLARRDEQEHGLRPHASSSGPATRNPSGPGEHRRRDHAGHHLRPQRLGRPRRDHADQRRVDERPEERRHGERGHTPAPAEATRARQIGSVSATNATAPRRSGSNRPHEPHRDAREPTTAPIPNAVKNAPATRELASNSS